MNKRFIIPVLTGALLSGCSVQPGPDVVLSVIAARAPSGGGPIPVQPRSDSDRSATENAAQEVARRPSPEQRPVGLADDKVTNVTVIAPYTFAGTWKITTPTKVSAGVGGPAKYSDVRQAVCRFEQSDEKLKGACVPFRKRMRGSLNGDTLTLDWTKGVASAHIDGTMLSETDFRGTISVGMLGSNIPTDMPAYGVKLLHGENSTAEIDDLASKVMADLAAGNFRPDRYSAAAIGKLSANSPLPQSDRVALGPQTALSFVTQAMIPATNDEAEKTMIVYDVEFKNGWRLCGFILDQEKKVGDIDCR